jgi:hypothetical protein
VRPVLKRSFFLSCVSSFTARGRCAPASRSETEPDAIMSSLPRKQVDRGQASTHDTAHSSVALLPSATPSPSTARPVPMQAVPSDTAAACTYAGSLPNRGGAWPRRSAAASARSMQPPMPRRPQEAHRAS